MLLFLFGLVLLIGGYYTYGAFLERFLAPDDRPTPAQTKRDFVDFIELPHWKNMLIQLLNIAGIGPVIGVILGIKFGSVAFLIIPVVNVLAGAVHDFLSGMMSIREEGANLTELVKRNLGMPFYRFFVAFTVFLLLLVVAVFINIPSQLINMLLPSGDYFYIIVGIIFLYYIIATLFPVDKIIGNVYPIFASVLLIGTVAIFVSLMLHANENWYLLRETVEFKAKMIHQPIIPCLFVTIACGMISGFHATQSPIVARTMATERQARSTFYGMMIIEGVIGMIWAAAGLAMYNLVPELMDENATLVLQKITAYFLNEYLALATVIGIVVLAVTSGDTAMRSLRLSLAEMLHLDQTPMRNRLVICVPLIAVILALLFWSNQSAKTFAQLWNYFAWGNQVLAAITLITAGAWLIRCRKNPLVAVIPGMFMTFIVVSFICWAAPDKGTGCPVGLDLSLTASYCIGGVAALIFAAFGCWKGRQALKK